jgi:hypothetical protein
MTAKTANTAAAAARKEFAAARTKSRNLRLKRYEGRNNGGDTTRNMELAGKFAREAGRTLEGLLWAEHRLAERVSEARDNGVDRPELRARLAGYRREIAALVAEPTAAAVDPLADPEMGHRQARGY